MLIQRIGTTRAKLPDATATGAMLVSSNRVESFAFDASSGWGAIDLSRGPIATDANSQVRSACYDTAGNIWIGYFGNDRRQFGTSKGAPFYYYRRNWIYSHALSGGVYGSSVQRHFNEDDPENGPGGPIGYRRVRPWVGDTVTSNLRYDDHVAQVFGQDGSSTRVNLPGGIDRAYAARPLPAALADGSDAYLITGLYKSGSATGMIATFNGVTPNAVSSFTYGGTESYSDVGHVMSRSIERNKFLVSGAGPSSGFVARIDADGTFDRYILPPQSLSGGVGTGLAMADNLVYSKGSDSSIRIRRYVGDSLIDFKTFDTDTGTGAVEMQTDNAQRTLFMSFNRSPYVAAFEIGPAGIVGKYPDVSPGVGRSGTPQLTIRN